MVLFGLCPDSWLTCFLNWTSLDKNEESFTKLESKVYAASLLLLLFLLLAMGQTAEVF